MRYSTLHRIRSPRQACDLVLAFSAKPDVAEQQMNAIIFYLTAFGYIDGNFDFTERAFIRDHIRQLVAARAAAAMPNADPKARDEVVNKFATHFHEVFDHIDRSVKELFDEAVAEGENVEGFVYAKLKLRSYEIFQSFDRTNQQALLATIDELIYADGTAHPAERAFRSEIEALLDQATPLADADISFVDMHPVAIADPGTLRARLDDHPFFHAFEQHYSVHPERIQRQVNADVDLMGQVIRTLAAQRAKGAGKLAGKQSVADFADQTPFLDGHVHVHPVLRGQRYELTVLGDLHGCYSCLKGAVLQSDFFAKIEAWKLDSRLPKPILILLGDYIDRGMFSYNGVMRAVMQLYVAAPDHVYPLRGNHEYYIEFRSRIYSGVRPAEAINTLASHVSGEVFRSYMQLFDELPIMLFFGDLLFVHAGIPRDSDLRAKFFDMASLNDADLRFQMLWSDPSSSDYIPHELQAQNARFPFGKRQFEAFMARLGCSMMVRGHEKVDGFKLVYGDTVSLATLFSAGGEHNRDLPPDSSYRSVNPMAATIRIEDGKAELTPWRIDYQRFNDPSRNRFFASPPEIAHNAG